MSPSDHVAASRLPQRYDSYWGEEFWSYVAAALRPEATVLDVGGGRRPTIPPDDRPPGVYYVGLDVAPGELAAAPEGSYDEIMVAGAQTLIPSLRGRFDLIVAWQVLEHVSDMRQVASVLHAYAKQGGWIVTCLSGRNAVFALANRILPAAVSSRMVSRLRRRPLESVFPAHYDHCTDRGLRSAFAQWEELQVIPLWHAADYFERLAPLQRCYLRYEDWAVERGLSDLATHYVVAARKGAS